MNVGRYRKAITAAVTSFLAFLSMRWGVNIGIDPEILTSLILGIIPVAVYAIPNDPMPAVVAPVVRTGV